MAAASLNEEEFDDLMTKKDSENTQKATKKAVTIFKEYLFERNYSEDFENLDKNDLGRVLSRFYVEARRSDGDHYKTGSLHSVRAGLNRHLRQNYHLGAETIDIIRDREFVAANKAFRTAIAELKRIGKGDVQHHQVIDGNDIAKLYSSDVFDQNTPTGLQLKVWFELMLYICRRGRENLRKLNKDHFVMATDSYGRQYVTQAVDEFKSNKTLEDNQSSRTDAGRMYETYTDKCPVRSFMKYRSKLNPESETLFQTPKSVIPSDVDSPWYKKRPVGKHTLGNFMSVMSKQARLSRPYTNHCIRATCISILDSKGFSARDICQISGRASEGSHSNYIGEANDAQIQELSDAISHSIGLQPLPVLAHATDLNTSNTRLSTLAVPENDTSLDFDVANQDMDLELPSSQLAFLEEIVERDVVSANDTNDENSELVDAALPGKTVSTLTVPAQNPGAVITSSTTRRTMHIQSLQQQGPFAVDLYNCNVIINYYIVNLDIKDFSYLPDEKSPLHCSCH